MCCTGRTTATCSTRTRSFICAGFSPAPASRRRCTRPRTEPQAMVTRTVRVVAAALLLTTTGAQTTAADDFAAERRRMVDDVTALVRETRAEIGKRSLDERVMAVMGKVPRHEFVPADQRSYAYENRPLPIGHGQTISQPYIVALMTDLARVQPGHKIGR